MGGAGVVDMGLRGARNVRRRKLYTFPAYELRRFMKETDTSSGTREHGTQGH